MDKLTSLLGFMAALSLATERIIETIKGLPVLSQWLAIQKPDGSTAEEFRKASIHILAIAVGTVLAYLTQDQIPTSIGLHYSGFWAYLLFGATASGGSGMWNSALDIVREVNLQKQVATQRLRAVPPPAKP